jgi:hypothetical protein
MDDGPAESLDAVDRARDVVDLEIRQRERIPGPASAGVNADRRGGGWGLPAVALALRAGLERDAEQL